MTLPRFTNYSILNYAAFNYAGFACISIIVFLSSTQPFFITEVIGIKPGHDSKIGSLIGLLGFADELTSMISSPLLGTLNDKLNSRGMNGSRIIQSSSFLIIALALFGYGVLSRNLVPDLFIFRCIFAIGVTGCMSMVTVLLNELSFSDFTFRKFIPGSIIDESQEEETTQQKRNGRFAALMGISTGLGAIFAVSTFVPLPVKLTDLFPKLDLEDGLKYSYIIVMLFSILSFIFLINSLYQSTNSRSEIKPEGYCHLLKRGLKFSKSNKSAQLAYLGAFVARSTTVATSIFIPLMVYEWYYNIGQCDSDTTWDGKLTCHDGYVFSAILTGVAQTVALVSAPIWGMLIDSSRVGKYTTLLIASIVGVIGNFTLSLLNDNYHSYNPKTITCFISVSIIGLSQIGLIISSMSILSGISNVHEIMGSLSGLYSFSGGIGIMILTLLGGSLSDYWILGPFFVLGNFNMILLVVCGYYIYEQRNPEPQEPDDESTSLLP
ncbi:uncharacterized protein J8A68_004468 [[Candida] subhashii]|uniref:Major facilitator superfamily (MFS) profile domain-containing protein n=1 Tax=[Candida] subhashii TaxID=561895 RepID=A0A8J5UFE5_9ASCO|nr:uncharacterized protein J8A68_004468 [[Candida] subhashii]KAG7661968.1 hypothetical protein J8A68_004468 [[Candida] subhashii]